MHCCISDERRAASHAQWISSAAGRSRIFCNLLDQMSDVDSRPRRTRRELLDEDRISRSRQPARKHQPGGYEGRQSENGPHRADPCSILPHFARWHLEDSRGDEHQAARHRVQWIRPREPRGSFRGWRKILASRRTRRGPWPVLLPHLGSVVDRKVARGSYLGGARERKKRQHATRRAGLECGGVPLEHDRAAGNRCGKSELRENGDEEQSPRDVFPDVQLDDGCRSRTRGFEKRLLSSSRTRKRAADGTHRAFTGFELPGFSLPSAWCRSRSWGWQPGGPNLLQHLSQPQLHHHAAAITRCDVGSRGRQDEQNFWRRDSRRQQTENHSVPSGSLYRREPHTLECAAWKPVLRSCKLHFQVPRIARGLRALEVTRLGRGCRRSGHNQQAGLGRYFYMEKIIGHDQILRGLSL